MNEVRQDWLLYDGECPLCQNYVSYLKLRDLSPGFSLRDARAEPVLVSKLFADGINVDEGFVLMWRGNLYQGADAIHMLSILSAENTVLATLNRAIFRSRSISAFVYPMLKAGRSILLRILGRKKLNGTSEFRRRSGKRNIGNTVERSKEAVADTASSKSPSNFRK